MNPQAINYWVDASGKEHRLDQTHVAWAAQQAGVTLPSGEDVSYMAEQNRVYNFMFARRWMKAALDQEARTLYVEGMATSQQKLWAVNLAQQQHLQVLDTEGDKVCDFRVKQESAERDLLLGLAEVDADLRAKGYQYQKDKSGTELYYKTLESPTVSGAPITVYVFVGTKQEKWDCAVALRIDRQSQRGGAVHLPMVYPPRVALLKALEDVEAAASNPATADIAGLELHMNRLRDKYKDPMAEARVLARRMLIRAEGPLGHVNRITETVDVRDWMMQQPEFTFTPLGDELYLVSIRDQFMPRWMSAASDLKQPYWPRTLGVIAFHDGRYSLYSGSPKNPRLPDEQSNQHYASREEAAVALWELAKDPLQIADEPPPPVREAVDPRDFIVDDPVRVYIETGRCPVCKSDEWIADGSYDPSRKPIIGCGCISCKSHWLERYGLEAMPDLPPEQSAEFVRKNEPPAQCPFCGGDIDLENQSYFRDWMNADKSSRIRSVLACKGQPNHTWTEVYQLIGLDIQPRTVHESADSVRDWILANMGKMTFFMKAYHPANPDDTLDLAYDYEFSTFDAAYKAAVLKSRDFYTEIEAWDIPATAWPHGDDSPVTMQNLWIVDSDGQVKEASPERKAEADRNARGPA